MNFVAMQVWIFFASIALGASFALCYDMLIALRREVKLGYTAVSVLDIIFAALLGMVSFIFMLAHVDGRLRFFIIVGEIIGALLYKTAISPLLLPLMQFCLRAVLLITVKPILMLLETTKLTAHKIISRLGNKFSAFKKVLLTRNSKKDEKLV